MNVKVRELVFMKCIFYVFKIFGLSTLKMNTTVLLKEKNLFFTHSKKDLLYNVFVIIVVFILNYFNIYHLLLLLKNDIMNNYQFCVSLVRYEFASATAIVILLQFCIKQKKFNLLIDKILFLRNSLVDYNEKMYYDESCLLLRRITYFCLINILPFIGFIITGEIYFYTGILHFISKCFSEAIINYAFVQFIILLMLINHFFKIINKNFSKLFVESSKSMEGKSIDFSRMHDLYFLLCKLSKKVSDFYNVSLFLSITYVFMTLLVFSYYTVTYSLKSQFSADKMKYLYYTVCRLFYCLILLIFLTKSATNINSEVSNHQINNNNNIII